MTKALTAIALSLLLATSALAAPFCTVFSYGRQCYYYDYQSCVRAAGSSGACIVNPNEVKAPNGGAPFCVVLSYGTNCWYYDAQTCRDAAKSSNGACVVRSN